MTSDRRSGGRWSESWLVDAVLDGLLAQADIGTDLAVHAEIKALLLAQLAIASADGTNDERTVALTSEAVAAVRPFHMVAIECRLLNDRALAQERLGNVRAAEGDWERAMALTSEAAAAGEAVPELLVDGLRTNLADLLYRRGEVAEAVDLLRSAHAGSADLPAANEGFLAEQHGRLDEAIFTYHAALSAACGAQRWSEAGVIAGNLASSHLRRGDVEAARSYGERAVELHERANAGVPLVVDLVFLGLLAEALGEPPQTGYYKRAWDVARERAPRSTATLIALAELGRCRFIEGDLQRARAALRRGMVLYDGWLRAHLAESEAAHEGALAAYRNVVEVALAIAVHDGWIHEVIALLENSKSRFWAEALIGAVPPDEWEAQATRPAVSADDMAQVAGHGTVVCSFFVGRVTTYVLYGAQGRFGVHRRLHGEAEVAHAVEEARFELLASPSRRGPRHEARNRLAAMLWGGLDLQFHGASTIVIFPDGPLWLAPFDALPPLPHEGGSLADLSPVLVNPSARVMASLTRSGPVLPVSRWHVHVTADPATGAELAPIDGTRRQAEMLSGLGAARHTALLADRARPDLFLATVGTATHVHIAAHAFGGDDPHLALADGNGAVERLGVADIASLRLQAQLVVLSACSTSLGASSVGEGVQSLARAFVFAGAACVMGTLWPIPDEGAAELFTTFYKRLASGSSVLGSLHSARAVVRAAGHGPRVWAALQVLGDGRRGDVM